MGYIEPIVNNAELLELIVFRTLKLCKESAHPVKSYKILRAWQFVEENRRGRNSEVPR